MSFAIASALRRLRSAALALGLLAAFAAPSLAQTQPPPPPAVLTALSTADAAANQTKLVLTFSPQAPKYSIIGDNTDKPGIAFALSTRAQAAVVPRGLKGPLKNVEFDQEETVLVLHFSVDRPTHVTAAVSGAQGLVVTLSTGVPAQAGGPAVPANFAGLPHAEDRDPRDDGFEVVPLKYADVSEVVGLLTAGLTVKSNDGFEPREPAFGSAGMTGQGAYQPNTPTNPDQLNQPLGQSVDDAIGIDRRLNAIILKGTPERIARLKAKIAEVDVPVQSVLLETVFVELTETGARNVGLDLANANGQLAVATYQSGAFITPGTATTHARVSGSLQAALYAQVQNGEGRIVSKPRIAAQSGSVAKIITGDALPILTAITLSGVNGVSQQVQYVNVGVTLQIAPRVSDDGYVTSHVFCVVSSVTGFSQGYPTISQREASTSATVHDGETFVIGGLTQENDLSSKTKVPGFGDIPIAGQLFHLQKGTKAKTELYIVVTPHVVKRGEPLPPEITAAEARP